MEFPSPKSLRMPAQAQTVLDWQESIHKDCGWQNLEKIHAAWFAPKIPYCFFPLAHTIVSTVKNLKRMNIKLGAPNPCQKLAVSFVNRVEAKSQSPFLAARKLSQICCAFQYFGWFASRLASRLWAIGI